MKKILLLCALVCASVVANAFTMDDIKNWLALALSVLLWLCSGTPMARLTPWLSVISLTATK